MSFDFELDQLPDEFFRHSQTEFMYKRMIPELSGAAVNRRTISPNYKVLRVRTPLGAWLKKRPYALSVRRVVDPVNNRTTRFSIWLELDNADDAMMFKLTWGGK